MANQYKEKRETLSKKDCKCSECGIAIKKGQSIIIDPSKKEVKCLKCNKNGK